MAALQEHLENRSIIYRRRHDVNPRIYIHFGAIQMYKSSEKFLRKMSDFKV